MIFQYLEPRVGDRWANLRCLDLACHESYFSLQLPLRGCREVLGIDAREEHVANAGLIRDLYGLANLSFGCGNVLELESANLGEFDVVLMLGLLYHVADIVCTLKAARALTKRICLIETQLAPELPAGMLRNDRPVWCEIRRPRWNGAKKILKSPLRAALQSSMSQPKSPRATTSSIWVPSPSCHRGRHWPICCRSLDFLTPRFQSRRQTPTNS